MSRLAPLLVLVLAGCSTQPTADPAPVADAPGSARSADSPRSPDQALAAGVAFLLKQQSADGAWRSDLYATFKDGPALTPLVVCALQESAPTRVEVALPPQVPAIRKGSEYLAKLVKPDGTIDRPEGDIDYPVYTAALSVIALSQPENKDLLKARDAWLKYLLDRQLTAKLGWKPEDKQYGGWGYCRLLPRKPEPNKIAPPLIESNLSATVFALEALRAAGVTDREVYEAAAVFVRRCQNWEPPVPGPRSPGADNGFFFIYDDPVRNKAGVRHPDGPFPFHSYGSTTADGLRALAACADPQDDDRRKDALGWLVQHFRADAHPGQYVAVHERNRDAVYFYYAASVSQALRAAGVKEAGKTNWATELAAELAKRQRADGSWANPLELVREDEPLVATANAVIALSNCRRAQAGK